MAYITGEIYVHKLLRTNRRQIVFFVGGIIQPAIGYGVFETFVGLRLPFVMSGRRGFTRTR